MDYSASSAGAGMGEIAAHRSSITLWARCSLHHYSPYTEAGWSSSVSKATVSQYPVRASYTPGIESAARSRHHNLSHAASDVVRHEGGTRYRKI